jgi:transcriptional regulator with XRE-family HTH domain
MESFSSSSVSIDGEAIRRTREEGKLTQLYVSKVVGVTTDTVSRWENNRYPTIRRDNALKLAEALEVELESILKREEPSTELLTEDLPLIVKSSARRYLFAGLLFIALLAIFFLLKMQPSPATLLSGHRHVPNFTPPGERVPIQLEISSEKKLKGLIVREEFPPGWNLVEADPPPASLDNLNGTVRWMIRDPALLKKIVYILQAPADIPLDTQVRLKGEVVANPGGQRFALSVPALRVMKIAPLHWADMNGNSRIDDLEILDVSDMVDAARHIHYDWDLIEQMWDAEGYLYDVEKRLFVPGKTVHSADE